MYRWGIVPRIPITSGSVFGKINLLNADFSVELASNDAIDLISCGINDNVFFHVVDKKTNTIIKEIDLSQVCGEFYKQSKDTCRFNFLDANVLCSRFVFIYGAATFGLSEYFKVGVLV